ncbi:GNAT family N-acetyltransferase [Stieleria sp. TO1_6]|uniref:GNAT family N-acetyltransferase n=1 Tax=Stieleria tagensis TaxID=2956795 RepID=UPI00209A715E|nr:GNAT family N-acetyltransferase [Stieleria tagensis]MCO8124024.1 GNAT family N-acetyltransferase [Stieleria tagensis]
MNPEPPPTHPLPDSLELRQALPDDVAAIHAMLRPFVMQRLLLSRTQAELVELTRHGFVAMEKTDASDQTGSAAVERCVGFAAVEVYSAKLAELQCLAVHTDYQRFGVGKRLVQMCVDRAAGLGVMEIMAISSSESFLQNCGFDYSLPDQKRVLFRQLRPRPYEDR